MRRIHIINGLYLSNKEKYINSISKLLSPYNCIVIPDDYSIEQWYKSLNRIEETLFVHDKEDIYISCCVTSRIRLNQLLIAIEAVGEILNREYEIDFIVFANKEKDIKELIHKTYRYAERELNELTKLYIKRQRKFIELMRSVEYFKYSLTFSEIELID